MHRSIIHSKKMVNFHFMWNLMVKCALVVANGTVVWQFNSTSGVSLTKEYLINWSMACLNLFFCFFQFSLLPQFRSFKNSVYNDFFLIISWLHLIYCHVNGSIKQFYLCYSKFDAWLLFWFTISSCLNCQMHGLLNIVNQLARIHHLQSLNACKSKMAYCREI